MMSLKSDGPKRLGKKVHLSVAQKLELIKKIEGGKTVAQVCEEYGVKKQTVSEIRKNKTKLETYAVTGSAPDRKHMKKSHNVQLDSAVYNWYVQQRSCGLSVTKSEISSSASEFAKLMGLYDFKASDGWYERFRQRHGIQNMAISSEEANANYSSVDLFRLQLKEVMKCGDYSLNEIYNINETGLMWHSLPRNVQAWQHEHKMSVKKITKISKERLSIMCGSNASGTHRIKLTVVGKLAKPRALRYCMQRLPIHYYSSAKAWFTSQICHDWFHRHLCPEIRQHQELTLKVPADNVKALILLDNCPAHPNGSVLESEDGRIKCMFLPVDTSAMIQPMDQGVISELKHRYQRLYLDEVLEVIETEVKKEDDTLVKRTLQNIKDYTIRAAIYNLDAAWGQMRITSFSNAWKKLLYDENAFNFSGIQAEDFLALLHRGGETAVTLEDVHGWMDENESLQGHEMLSDAEIVEFVTGHLNSTDNAVEMERETNVPLSTVRDCLNIVLKYVSNNSKSYFQDHYDSLRILRSKVIKEQHKAVTETKSDTFQPGAIASAASQPTTSTAMQPSHTSQDTVPISEESTEQMEVVVSPSDCSLIHSCFGLMD